MSYVGGKPVEFNNEDRKISVDILIFIYDIKNMIFSLLNLWKLNLSWTGLAKNVFLIFFYANNSWQFGTLSHTVCEEIWMEGVIDRKSRHSSEVM